MSRSSIGFGSPGESDDGEYDGGGNEGSASSSEAINLAERSCLVVAALARPWRAGQRVPAVASRFSFFFLILSTLPSLSFSLNPILSSIPL